MQSSICAACSICLVERTHCVDYGIVGVCANHDWLVQARETQGLYQACKGQNPWTHAPAALLHQGDPAQG